MWSGVATRYNGKRWPWDDDDLNDSDSDDSGDDSDERNDDDDEGREDWYDLTEVSEKGEKQWENWKRKLNMSYCKILEHHYLDDRAHESQGSFVKGKL